MSARRRRVVRPLSTIELSFRNLSRTARPNEKVLHRLERRFHRHRLLTWWSENGAGGRGTHLRTAERVLVIAADGGIQQAVWRGVADPFANTVVTRLHAQMLQRARAWRLAGYPDDARAYIAFARQMRIGAPPFPATLIAAE